MSQFIQTPQPSVQPPVMLQPKKSSGFKKFLLIGGGLFLLLILVMVFSGDSEATGKPVDPTVTLSQAEANIIGSGDGSAYSNSEEGQALAAAFGTLFKKVALEGTDTIKDRHEFLTHCQLNDDSVLFLVHVPKLRKFEEESKERFCEFAWEIAHAVLAQSGKTAGLKLAVGVKGMALYQNIYFGEFDPTNLEAENQGVKRKTDESSSLESFFKGA